MRFFQYQAALLELGFKLSLSPLLPDKYLIALYAGKKDWPAVISSYFHRLLRLLDVRGFDVVWLEKEAFPWLPVIAECPLFSAGTPVVTDFDDAIFHSYDLHASELVRRLLGDKIDSVMRRSRTVMAGNEYLAARAQRAGAADVQIVPTVVDLGKYQVEFDRRSNPLVIGWIGSPATEHFLQLVAGPIEDACVRYNCRFVAIGAARLPFDRPWATIVPWSAASESSQIGQIDVGIMPLPDSPWERGKCGYKLIQYMASGKPVIASPVGANTVIVRHGEDGFLADTPEGWILAFNSLLTDAALRERMGRSGRARVEEVFSLHATTPRVAAILKRAAEEI